MNLKEKKKLDQVHQLSHFHIYTYIFFYVKRVIIYTINT